MGFLKKLFKTNDSLEGRYKNFWKWFYEREGEFHNVLKENGDVHGVFFTHLAKKLDLVKEGFWYLAGMNDNETAELIITVDSDVKNIAFAEELINAAPKIPGWTFTALKQALDISHIKIAMDGFEFSKDNLFFYQNEIQEYPDEVDITVVHNDYTEENKSIITNGVYIFLEHYLGELRFSTDIDNLIVEGKKESKKELIPIIKLNEFLYWREKEFVEKYSGVKHDTENDAHASFEAQLGNGYVMIGVVNTDLINWDAKASHPWLVHVEISYDGGNNNGLPIKSDYQLLDQIENLANSLLKDVDGYLNVGRESGNNQRSVYFACKDFRLPSKVFYELQKEYASKFEINFSIYKDKYWRSVEKFQLG